jgi:hypothetical protein
VSRAGMCVRCRLHRSPLPENNLEKYRIPRVMSFWRPIRRPGSISYSSEFQNGLSTGPKVITWYVS